MKVVATDVFGSLNQNTTYPLLYLFHVTKPVQMNITVVNNFQLAWKTLCFLSMDHYPEL